MNYTHTVVVILESKKEKEDELEAALKAVAEKSRAEKSCLEYRFNRCIENSSQFILYENWESKEKHQEQFSKPYILGFIAKLDVLLVRPYQAFFAKEIF